MHRSSLVLFRFGVACLVIVVALQVMEACVGGGGSEDGEMVWAGR